MIDRLNTEKLLSCLLLCGLLLTAVRYEGQLHRLPNYIAIFLLMLLVIFRRDVKYNKSAFLSLLLFSITGLIHVYINFQYTVLNILGESIFVYYLNYIALIWIYFLIFPAISVDAIERVGPAVFKSYIIASLLLFVISILGVANIGVEIDYSPPRIQGMVTEPSNFAHFLPGVFLFFLYSKNYRWIFISLVCCLLTQSPTVYLVLILTIFSSYFIKSKISYKIIVFVVLFLLIMTIGMQWNYLEGLDPSTFDPVRKSSIRIIQGISFLFSLGDLGVNSRGILLLDGIEFMETNKMYWFGVGLGATGPIGEVFNDGLAFDANSIFSFYMWFGAAGVLIYFLAYYKALQGWSPSLLSCIVLSQFFSNSINGGGVWIQVTSGFFLILLYKNKRKNA